MPINPVILFNDRLQVFEKDFLYDISQINLLSKFNKCFNIGYLTIIVSSNRKEILEIFDAYYDFQSKVRNNTSVALIKLNIGPELSLNSKNFTWLYEKEGILKGKDEFNSIIYKYKGVTMIKSYDNHLMEVVSNSIEDLIASLPVLTKVIEGLIIDNYLGLGYFPIHSSFVANEKEAHLILGNSQSGKTTFAENLRDQAFQVLSDEITLISLYEVIPFGQYIKKYVNSSDKSCVECFNGVYREVNRIETKIEELPDINKIYLMKLSTNKTGIEELTNESTKIQLLTEYLHDIPNEYFINRSISYFLLTELVKKLVNIKFFIKYSEYR